MSADLRPVPVFLALLFAYVLSQFYRAFLAVVAGALSRDLGLDAAGLGTLLAAWFGAFALAQFPIGLALDRFGPRRTLAWGMCSAVLGAAWLANATRLADAGAAMALIGAGCAPVLMAGFYLIARTYPLDRFATLSSLLLGLGSLGDPLSGTPLAMAVGAWGWRAAMGGMAAITAVGALTVALVLRDPPRVEAPEGGGSKVDGVRTILGLKALWPILPLALVSYAAVMSTRGLWITPYLERVHGLDPSESSVAATAMGLAMAGGALLYAPLNRLWGGPKRTAAIGIAITVVAWLALGFLGERSVAGAITLLLVAGCFGAPFAIVMAHARSFMPTHLLGLGITLMNIVFMGGVSLGQWLSGRFIRSSEVAGLAPPTLYGGLFASFGCVLLVALLIYTASPRERRVAV